MPYQDAEAMSQLADPTRRALYEHVAESAEPVSREQAAEAMDLPVHQVKFHLDRLERAGLLTSDYVRLSGRSGPGAGRPAKRYRPADGEMSVSAPPREYDLAGRILANAITRARTEGASIDDAVRVVAREQGRALADPDASPPGSPADALDRATGILRAHGYAPQNDDGRVTMLNCPFHSLAQENRDLVCTMNHELIEGLDETLEPYRPSAVLDPQAHRCCVILTADGK